MPAQHQEHVKFSAEQLLNIQKSHNTSRFTADSLNKCANTRNGFSFITQMPKAPLLFKTNKK